MGRESQCATESRSAGLNLRLVPSFLRLLSLDLTAMAEQQQFYILLGNLMSPDNNVRKHSEVREYNIAVYQPGRVSGRRCKS